MQLLYINELEKKKPLDDFHVKQRIGIKALPNDEILNKEQIERVMQKVVHDSIISANFVKKHRIKK